MDEIKKKFIEGLINNQPQLLTKNLIGDLETPISCLLKINKNQKYLSTNQFLEIIDSNLKKSFN